MDPKVGEEDDNFGLVFSMYLNDFLKACHAIFGPRFHTISITYHSLCCDFSTYPIHFRTLFVPIPLWFSYFAMVFPRSHALAGVPNHDTYLLEMLVEPTFWLVPSKIIQMGSGKWLGYTLGTATVSIHFIRLANL